jgi:hypothetical protein
MKKPLQPVGDKGRALNPGDFQKKFLRFIKMERNFDRT